MEPLRYEEAEVRLLYDELQFKTAMLIFATACLNGFFTIFLYFFEGPKPDALKKLPEG